MRTKRSMFVIEKPSLSMIIITILFVILMRGSASSFELYLKIGLTFLWIFMAALENIEAIKSALSNRLAVCVYIYVVIKLMINLAICAKLTEPINSALVSISFYIGIFAVRYYYQSEKDLERLVVWTGIIYLFYCIKAIVFYIQNPGAGRIFSEYRETVAIGNGYGIAFGCAVAAAYFVGLLKIQRKEERNLKIQTAFIILITISILVCFFVQSSITLYSMAIGIVFNLIFVSKSENLRKQLVVFVVVIAAIVFIFYNLDFIARFALDFCKKVERNAMVDRIRVLANYRLYGTQAVAISGRQRVYIESINSFFSHPVLGASVNTSYSDLRLIGDHSSILDDFGRYGIVVGILNIYIFTKPMLNHIYSRYYKAFGALITLCLVAIFDPVTQSTATAIIFWFIGLVEVYYIKKFKRFLR